MTTYKAAVIGLGKIGLTYDFEPNRPHPSTHVYAYTGSHAFQMACGIDGDASKKTLLGQVAPNAAFFSSLEAALESRVLEDVDVVSVCTPPSDHLRTVRLLLDNRIGRIIFCEKPIVNSLAEARELEALLQERPEVLLIPDISRRWNKGMERAAERIKRGEFGKLEEINIRYTRGIYNTGSHLFDLLVMWTGERIERVQALRVTHTSAEPEKSYSFYFETESGATGYAEAVDDARYYLFEVDLYFTDGKVEMRSSGDDMLYYKLGPHHLFEGFGELKLQSHETGLLSDACIGNAVENIFDCLQGKDVPRCTVREAIYPLYVADALGRSYQIGKWEEVYNG